jgi:hypothetical protein
MYSAADVGRLQAIEVSFIETVHESWMRKQGRSDELHTCTRTDCRKCAIECYAKQTNKQTNKQTKDCSQRWSISSLGAAATRKSSLQAYSFSALARTAK